MLLDRIKPRKAPGEYRARGTGWGGEAKGRGSQSPRHANFLSGCANINSMMTQEQREEARSAREEQEEWADLAVATVFKIMTDDRTYTQSKLDAAAKLHKFVRGEKHTQSHTIDDLTQLTDEQLAERLAVERYRTAALAPERADANQDRGGNQPEADTE